MTTLLERERSTNVEEPAAPGNPLRGGTTVRRSNGVRAWIASAVAVAVIAAGAVAVSLNQADASEPLAYRSIGEVEALQRFASSSVVPGLSYRAIGEVEALERFATG